MALTRRVAATVPQQKASPEAAATAPDEVPTVEAQQPLLDHVPTQRGVSPEPAAPAAAPDHRRGRTAMVAVALAVTGALVAGGAVVQHQRTVRVAERQAAQVRVADALTVLQGDATDTAPSPGDSAWAAALAGAREAARTAAATGSQQLAAAPHAGDPALAALKAAVDSATATAADPTTSLTALTVAAAGVAAPAKAAADAEAAWQAAEQARIAAAQQAAAQQAAQEAAAKAAAAAKPATKKPAKTHSSAPSSTSNQPAAPPAGGATQSIPSGGLVCPGAPVGAAASESSVDAIGAAINAYRQSNGLPALGIVRSGTLVAHAEDMAASGGIWHSGQDNIVGCSSGGVQSLVNAWSRSAPHNAQMLRTDVTTMKVGGATGGGWLYGAVKFSA